MEVLKSYRTLWRASKVKHFEFLQTYQEGEIFSGSIEILLFQGCNYLMKSLHGFLLFVFHELFKCID